jgi:hypothetical protein
MPTFRVRVRIEAVAFAEIVVSAEDEDVAVMDAEEEAAMDSEMFLQNNTEAIDTHVMSVTQIGGS